MVCSCVSLLFYIIVGLVSVIYYFFHRKFSYWKDRGVNYIEPIIPTGNLPRGKLTEPLMSIVQRLYDLRDERPFAGAFLLLLPVVVATDIEFIKNILVKDFTSFHGRGLYNDEKYEPLSAHLLSLDGPKWKWLRMKLSPTFTSEKMKFMFSTLVEVAERFDQTLSEITKTKKILDTKDLLARFTTDVIGACAFGIECNSLKDPDCDFRKYGILAFKPLGGFRRTLITQFPKIAKFLCMRLLQKEASDFFLDIVEKTVDYREKKKIRRNDFMDLLIDLKNNETVDSENNIRLEKLTLKQVAAQAFLFFIAGFETSSTTMNFALYELALNNEIQEKARKEINEVLAKHDGKLTYEAVADMSYVDHILSETLRKYPTAPLLIRKSQANYDVPNSKFTIEKGTTVFIPAYAVHHDPQYYPDPETFDPDRFSPEQMKTRPAVAFLGFGDGPRNCIGLRFGRMQSRVGLIMLLKNYRFKTCAETPKKMEFGISFILTPKNILKLEIEII